MWKLPRLYQFHLTLSLSNSKCNFCSNSLIWSVSVNQFKSNVVVFCAPFYWTSLFDNPFLVLFQRGVLTAFVAFCLNLEVKSVYLWRLLAKMYMGYYRVKALNFMTNFQNLLKISRNSKLDLRILEYCIYCMYLNCTSPRS